MTDLWSLLGPVHEQALRTARRLCRSPSEGDDLYQEAVLRAMDRVAELRDPAKFRAWFYQVLLSVHRARTRRGFWRRMLALEALPASAEPAGDDGARWEDERHRARRLADALATLPSEQREAIVLFEIDGFSIEEVAAMQRASVPAVKSRLTRGRDKLRAHYEKSFRRVEGTPHEAHT